MSKTYIYTHSTFVSFTHISLITTTISHISYQFYQFTSNMDQDQLTSLSLIDRQLYSNFFKRCVFYFSFLCNVPIFNKDEECAVCNSVHEELCYFCLKCDAFIVDYLDSECFIQKHYRDLRVKAEAIRKEIMEKFPSFLLPVEQPAVEGSSKRKAPTEESEAAVCLPLPSTSKRIRCEGKTVRVDLEEDDDCITSLAGKFSLIFSTFLIYTSEYVYF